MRHVGDIFEQESYRETGIRTMSGVILTRIICSVISGVAAIGIIANFGTVTARIAIFMATNTAFCAQKSVGIITSYVAEDIPSLKVIIVIIYSRRKVVR